MWWMCYVFVSRGEVIALQVWFVPGDGEVRKVPGFTAERSTRGSFIELILNELQPVPAMKRPLVDYLVGGSGEEVVYGRRESIL